MNKLLRKSFAQSSWSQTEGLLNYMREMECFGHMSGRKDVNPYWWGSTFDYEKGWEVIKDLIDKKSIKKSRLIEISNEMAEDLNSPIVRITGLHLLREAEKYEN